MKSEARQLAEKYYEMNPEEAEQLEQHVQRNKLDPEKIWLDLEQTFANWLQRLRLEPNRALAVWKGTMPAAIPDDTSVGPVTLAKLNGGTASSWGSKVTRAFFALKGRALPKSKKDMVAIAQLYTIHPGLDAKKQVGSFVIVGNNHFTEVYRDRVKLEEFNNNTSTDVSEPSAYKRAERWVKEQMSE